MNFFGQRPINKLYNTASFSFFFWLSRLLNWWGYSRKTFFANDNKQNASSLSLSLLLFTTDPLYKKNPYTHVEESLAWKIIITWPRKKWVSDQYDHLLLLLISFRPTKGNNNHKKRTHFFLAISALCDRFFHTLLYTIITKPSKNV